MNAPTSPLEGPLARLHPRWDPWLTAGLGLALLGVLAPILGIWEPWEADLSLLVETMRDGDLFLVPPPDAAGRQAPPAELPYRFWPVIAGTWIFGVTEIGLRLPSVLVSVAALIVMMLSVRATYGRLAAWFAVATALGLPLFTFHGRHAFGLGVGSGLLAIAVLALLRAGADRNAPRAWAWIGWISSAAAALSLGAVGLVAPVAAAVVAALASDVDEPPEDRRARLFRVLSPVPFGIAIVAVTAGWWIAVSESDASLISLLLWVDPLEAVSSRASPPTFEAFVHQIGYGLFPVGALVPFAFAAMLWSDRPSDEPASAHRTDLGVSAWFAVAFLAPALAVPATHGAFFLAPLSVAVAVGVYLSRVVRQPAQPIIVVATVFVLALLDSNLKHDTQSIGDVIVGDDVTGFPAKFGIWSVSRGVSMALLGVLILVQGGVRHHIVRIVRALAYPARRLPWLSGPGSGLALAVALLIHLNRPDWLSNVVQQKFWHPLVPGARRFAVLMAIGLIAAAIFTFFYRWWANHIAGRTDGWFIRSAASVQRMLDDTSAPSYALGAVLVIWAIFVNVPLAGALTVNFSQKGLVDLYRSVADEDEPLYNHRIDRESASFYARNLPELSVTDFKEKATEPTRFFAIAPRADLASINSEFRRATSQTLPVIDGSGSRYLLISNQLGEQEDHNPIKKALLETLPSDVSHRTSINFEDKIELVGWRLDPERPKAGSPLRVELFWKVLERVSTSYKVFVHIDASGVRIHGDHDPVEGLYPTTNWAVGDIVHDVHHIASVKSSATPGRYTFYCGLFRGNTRMKIKSGSKDDEDRGRLGTVVVR